MSTLPKQLGKIEALIKLYCQKINLADSCFSFLINLETLDLSHNKLKQLPDSFDNLFVLKQFDCHDNLLESLPDSFGHLSDLDKSNCSHNNLKTLPETIGELFIKDFNLSHNHSLVTYIRIEFIKQLFSHYRIPLVD